MCPSENEMSPLALLNNRYRLISLLSDEGGFGETYLAEDQHLPSRSKCVVKKLKPLSENPQTYQLILERFHREAAILENLSRNYPEIPKLYAYLVEEGEFYLVEEWIEGDTLTQKLKREGNWTEKKARELLQKILHIIAYIHQNNIIHRDIKPDNLILRGEQPVLIDFGAVKETMSCVLNSQGKSSRSIVVGTEGFMPPEQATGRPTYSSDLYSLGLTIIYLLTGKHPQDLDYDPGTGKIHWHNHCSQITENFRQILDKAINPNPHERFQSAPAMLASLESDQTAKTVPTPTVIIQDVPVASPPPVTQILPLPVEPKTGEWKKAMIIGGLIGGSILASTLVLQNTLKEKLPAPKAETVQPSPLVASALKNLSKPS